MMWPRDCSSFQREKSRAPGVKFVVSAMTAKTAGSLNRSNKAAVACELLAKPSSKMMPILVLWGGFMEKMPAEVEMTGVVEADDGSFIPEVDAEDGDAGRIELKGDAGAAGLGEAEPPLDDGDAGVAMGDDDGGVRGGLIDEGHESKDAIGHHPPAFAVGIGEPG